MIDVADFGDLGYGVRDHTSRGGDGVFNRATDVSFGRSPLEQAAETTSFVAPRQQNDRGDLWGAKYYSTPIAR